MYEVSEPIIAALRALKVIDMLKGIFLKWKNQSTAQNT